MSTSLVFVAALMFSAGFYVWRVGINLTLSSVLLGLMLTLHGPAYLYYTRVWGSDYRPTAWQPRSPFFEKILSAAPYTDVIGTLDLALAISFASICLGVVAADFAFGIDGRRMRAGLRDWTSQPTRVTPGVANRLQFVAAISLFLLVTFAAVENKFSGLIMFYASDLGEFAKIALRREFGGSRFYILNLAVSSIFPFFAFCCYVALRERSMKPQSFAWLFVTALMLAKTATLSKAPPSIFILQLFVVEYMRRSLDLPMRTIVKFLVICIALFGAMTLIAIRELHGFDDTLGFLFYRIFMIPNESLLEYYAAIPSVIPHTWGTKFSWLVGLLSTQPTHPTYLLVGAAHRGVEGSTSTAMFIADAWADFSWFGVCVFSLFAGFFIRWLDVELIINRGKTAASIAGIALGHYGIFVMLSTALQTAMLTGGLILIAPLVIVLSSKLRWAPSNEDNIGHEASVQSRQV